MDTAFSFVDGTINGFIWGIVPWFLVAAGLYFGLRTLFVQVRLLPSMFKAVAETPKGKDREGRDLDAEYGGISAFKAFTISAASRVGTGNIAGVALAISIAGRVPCSGCGCSPSSAAPPRSWSPPWRSCGRPRTRTATTTAGPRTT